jgi:gluconokinase
MRNGNSIIALDLGTTSTKGILFRIGHGIIATCSREYPTLYPLPGRAEQDPEQVLDGVLQVVRGLVEDTGTDPSAVSCLAFGGILHSLLPVDREGRPLSNALIWADMRAERQCTDIRSRLDTDQVRLQTGCPLHPLYSLPRLLWFREHAKELFETAVRFVSIKEFVLQRLYGEYVVDRSIASGTGLMNTSSLDWDETMLEVAGVRRQRLSEIVDTAHVLPRLRGETAKRMGLSEETPGVVGASDGPLAHLGSVGMNPARMSLTIGTSAALRKAVSEPTVVPGSEAWCYYMTEGIWLVGGVVHDAGNVIQWIQDRFLSEPKHGTQGVFDLLDRAKREVPPGSEGLLFLPFMSGERSPFYNPEARSAVIGMTFSHTPAHLLRAAVEGIAFRVQEVLDVLDPGGSCELTVTGGILRSESWLQITADFLGRKLFRSGVQLASAWGAALIALRALGLINSLDEINSLIEPGQPVLFDRANHDSYRSLKQRYDEYYRKLFT